MTTRLPEVLFTVDSLAEYLSFSKSHVYKLAASGRIRSFKLGKELRFSSEHVVEYLQSCDSDKATDQDRPTSIGRTTKRSRKKLAL